MGTKDDSIYSEEEMGEDEEDSRDTRENPGKGWEGELGP